MRNRRPMTVTDSVYPHPRMGTSERQAYPIGRQFFRSGGWSRLFPGVYNTEVIGRFRTSPLFRRDLNTGEQADATGL